MLTLTGVLQTDGIEKMAILHPLIVANWKMHGSRELVTEITNMLGEGVRGAELVVCPPSVWLRDMDSALGSDHQAVRLGAQDCHMEKEGAFTGDVSARMLREIGCDYVIVGHSERRTHHVENDAQIGRKATAALVAGLTPIICVGEAEEERDAGHAVHAVQEQLALIIEELPDAIDQYSGLVLAYEPVWAIGTGRVPSMEDIEVMHAVIRQFLTDHDPAYAHGLRVLYGGSVKPANAAGLIAVNGVDGFLIGGASLQPASFKAIAEAAAEVRGRQAA